jgi:hypothetical protein
VPSGRDADRPYQLHDQRCRPARGAYRQAFGFEPMEIERHAGTSFARLTGVEGAQARAVRFDSARRRSSDRIHRAWRAIPGRYRLRRPAIPASPLSSPTWRAPICDCAHVRGGPRSLGGHRNDYPRLQEVSPHSSFGIRRGIRSSCSRSCPITYRRAGARHRIETVHALGSITPPSSFLAHLQASRSTSRSWDFPSPALAQSRPGAGTA